MQTPIDLGFILGAPGGRIPIRGSIEDWERELEGCVLKSHLVADL